jgi:hypothetical protein
VWDFCELFRPEEMFEVTNPGVYEMQFRMRICILFTNGAPDYSVMTNSHKFFPATNLDILTSPPLRVGVIKG